MTDEQAWRDVAEVITPQRWDAFVEWLEEAEDGGDGRCAHDPMDYEVWLREQGDGGKLAERAQAVWDAFEALGRGPCRCNAGAQLWRGNELDDVTFPVLYARPIDLPRAFTGLPEELSAEQEELYGKFFGARRGPDAVFSAVPEPPFSGDVNAGMALAQTFAWLGCGSPAHESIVHSADLTLRMFFHSGSFEDVRAHYEQVGRPLVPLMDVLDHLAAFALLDGDGHAVQGAHVRTEHGDVSAGFHALGHLVVAQPEQRTVWLGNGWQPFPEDGLVVVAEAGTARLVLDGAGLHATTLR